MAERARERIGGARGERAERVAGAGELALRLEPLEISGPPATLVDRGQELRRPGQPVAARRTPAARLLREERLQVLHHRDRTGAVVEDDHGPGAEAAPGLRDRVEVHRHVEML